MLVRKNPKYLGPISGPAIIRQVISEIEMYNGKIMPFTQILTVITLFFNRSMGIGKYMKGKENFKIYTLGEFIHKKGLPRPPRLTKREYRERKWAKERSLLRKEKEKIRLENRRKEIGM